MIKRVAAVLCLILIQSVNSSGQAEFVFAKYKNGVTYVGEKIEENETTSRLLLNTGDTIRIDRRQLSRYFDSNSALIHSNGKYMQTQGGFWDLSFGVNLGIFEEEEEARASTHLELIYGWRVDPRLNIGVGMGFEFNEAEVAGFQFDTQFSTFFAHGRYYLTNGSRRIFAFSRIGVGYPAEENEDGNLAEHSSGVNTLTGVGIHWASRRNTTFHLSLGYYTQKTHGREFFLDNLGNEVATNFDILIKRMMLKFTWEFG